LLFFFGSESWAGLTAGVQAVPAGFDHHLTKPVDENVLETLIDEALTD
jgi:hypothetical protein